jgi:hypothetical protein
VERLAVPARPVEDGDLSTTAVHCENGSGKRGKAVFHDIHTPSYYYELF